MVILFTLCGILFVLVILEGIAIKNLLKKVETYEDFSTTLLEEVQHILDQIRSIDIRGSFEADDEVGIVYAGIRGMVMRLKQFLEVEEE